MANSATDSLPPPPKNRHSRLVIGVLVVVIIAGGSALVTLLRVGRMAAPVADPAHAFPGATLAFDYDTKLLTSISNLEAAATLGRDLTTTQERFQASVEFVERAAILKGFGVEDRAELRPTVEFADPLRAGYSVVRIAQVIPNVASYGEVPIFGGEIAVSVRDAQGAISSISARASTSITDLNPEVPQGQAQARALQFYQSIVGDDRGSLENVDAASPGQLVYFEPARLKLGGDPTLAWRVRVGVIETFIGANRGDLIFAYDTRRSALIRQTYDCGTPGCPLILDNAKQVANTVASAAQQAHDAAAKAHAYFLKRFSRDGYDDRGGGVAGKGAVKANVRVSRLKGARWTPATKLFEYGTGWTLSDVTAHEYMHAVTEFGPGLINASESGSVGEFFSDFFSVMIERFHTGRIDWLIGEGAPGFSPARPVRNMADPHNGAFNPNKDFDLASNWGQPEHYGELVTTSHDICATRFLADNSCVHFNSGILSKAAFLAVGGGTFRNTTVTALGPDKVEQILFQALMGAGLTSSSGLKETTNAAVAACDKLVGQYGIQAADCTNFNQAFVAVGLR